MFADGIFIDGFAGGGGASTGIAHAIGRDPDIAVNHSETALAIHKANHPDTEHHCTDIRLPFLPMRAARGRRVTGMWMSPDCKEFSKAKGGPVKDRSIRTLADEIPHWIEQTRPEVVFVENVEEFEDWGPLEQGEDGKWRVIVDRKGEDFQKWVRRCRRLGYRVAWRQLRACDYGAPTSRKRLYIIMRRDGGIVWPKPTHGHPDSAAVKAGKLLPYRTAAECIDWSIPCPSIFTRQRELAEATKRRIAHGVMRYVVNAARPFIVPLTHQGSVRVHNIEEPFRTITGAHRGELAAADVQIAPHITKFHSNSVGSPMDKEMPTVTGNGQPTRPAGAMPLGRVDATLAPFVTYGQQGGLNRSVNAPMHTVAASSKDTNGLAEIRLAPHVMTNRNAAKPFTAADEPTHTITAGGAHQNAVTAFLSSFYTNDAAKDAREPMPTAMAGAGKHAVVAAHLEQANGGPRNKNSAGRAADRPLSTATTTGSQQRIVETTLIEEGALPPEMMERAVRTAAFLVQYYATGGENEEAQSQAATVPLRTVTTRARFAVVTVTIDAVTYVIVDIGLRMLKPRELARAQGFPDDYVLDPIVRKFLRGKWVERRLTIAEQISAIGNSVCPPVAQALVAANQPGAAIESIAA